MENKPKWRKLKIKPRKVNNVQQHHEDYFLVQSVYMDVLIKKQFYDDVNKQKMPKVYEEITSNIPWHTDITLFFMHVYYTNIPIYFCLRFLNIPKYVITSSLKKFFIFYMTKQGVIHNSSFNNLSKIIGIFAKLFEKPYSNTVSLKSMKFTWKYPRIYNIIH